MNLNIPKSAPNSGVVFPRFQVREEINGYALPVKGGAFCSSILQSHILQLSNCVYRAFFMLLINHFTTLY